jgi:carbon storage regulator
MLVLSRKAGEEIIIGDNIKIVVSRISGNRVTLGVDAPNSLHIIRGELEPFAREFAEEAGVRLAVPIPDLTLRDQRGLTDFPRSAR